MASSSGGIWKRPSSRSPGVSATQPPAGPCTGISSAETVVWRPLWSTSLTSPVASCSPGWTALRSVDLPTPGRAGDDADPAGQPIPEPIDVDRAARRHVLDRVADALVLPEQLTGLRLADQVDLVRDQHGVDLVGLGDDEEAVHQAQVRRGIRAGEDDQHLVDIGDEQVLAPYPARSGLAAAELGAPRLDLLDHAAPVRQGGDRDAVTDDGEIGALAILLDAAAHPRLDGRAVVGQDGVEAAARAQHGTGGQGGLLSQMDRRGAWRRRRYRSSKVAVRASAVLAGSWAARCRSAQRAEGCRRTRVADRVVIGVAPFACV